MPFRPRRGVTVCKTAKWNALASSIDQVCSGLLKVANSIYVGSPEGDPGPAPTARFKAIQCAAATRKWIKRCRCKAQVFSVAISRIITFISERQLSIRELLSLHFVFVSTSRTSSSNGGFRMSSRRPPTNPSSYIVHELGSSRLPEHQSETRFRRSARPKWRRRPQERQLRRLRGLFGAKLSPIWPGQRY